jgi:hypothetical protein
MLDPEYSVYQYKLADRFPKNKNAVLLSAEVSPIESLKISGVQICVVSFSHA